MGSVCCARAASTTAGQSQPVIQHVSARCRPNKRNDVIGGYLARESVSDHPAARATVTKPAKEPIAPNSST